EIGLRQQSAVVGAHEQRAVRPVADERAIVPAALDHDAGDAERERAVAAGADAQPQVGLAGEAGEAWIDDDQPRGAPDGPHGPRRVSESPDARALAPQPVG